MKIVSRPDIKLIIQFRQFKRTKKGGMEHSGSRTITIHDADIMDELFELLKTTIEARSPKA